MSETASWMVSGHKGWLRFGRVIAILAGCLALLGLDYAPIAFVPAALLSAVIALTAGIIARDAYPIVGSLIAAVIALGSPAAWQVAANVHQQHVAEQAQKAKEAAAAASEAANAEAQRARAVTEAIKAVAEFETGLRSYQPDIDSLESRTATYARITAALRQDQVRYNALNDAHPDRGALLYRMTSAQNRTDQLHNEVAAAKSSFAARTSNSENTWANVQAACARPEIAKSGPCMSVGTTFASYSNRVTQVRTALQEEEAAYLAQKAEQQRIMDSVS